MVVIEPQRYNFLSKSQRALSSTLNFNVVIEPQRYNFLSKSQPDDYVSANQVKLLLNHKDTIF